MMYPLSFQWGMYCGCCTRRSEAWTSG